MSMTFLAAAQDVARSVGGSSVSAQIVIAKSAVQQALRDFDTRHQWDYKLSTLSDIAVTGGTANYDLVTAGGVNPKSIHSARLKNNLRTLGFVRQREWDRLVWNQESNEIPTSYTEVRGANAHLNIKLLPTPSQGETLQVRVFEHIVIPSADGDVLDVFDRYLPAILALARYYFIIDRDAEDARAGVYLQKAEQLIQKAINDDDDRPDEDIHFTPTSEWASGWNRDPINGDLF